MAETSAVQQQSESNGKMWLSLVAIVMGTFVAVLNSSLKKSSRQL